VSADLAGWEVTIGQALADAIAWRRAVGGRHLDEFIGLYRSAAKDLSIPLYATAAGDLGIPGDVSRGPGRWHLDADQVPGEDGAVVLFAGDRALAVEALTTAAVSVPGRAFEFGRLAARLAR